MDDKLKKELNKKFGEYSDLFLSDGSTTEDFIFSGGDTYSDSDSYGDAVVGSDW